MIKRNADSSVAMRLMYFSQCTTVEERQWVNVGAPEERRETGKKASGTISRSQEGENK